ncbi:hypothetical protein HK103_002661 [Boothiomyces macroporosus]|uniref:Phosphotyrosine protein phosphatase I domain-containing protein n=1 Tax=Boothiomyces macroporosus TaxID=261099 RepID=A0AAD5UMF5_9FUNG|nr:hypothetical protein HK103_002661 [Boothiomyces macroporosus]
MKVLFLCTHNSARSQMAEAILRKLDSDLPVSKYESFSAGTEKTLVRPLAIEAMQDWNVDMSKQYSKTLDEFLDQDIDLVVTVCDNANDTCPFFPRAKKRLHWSFPDPSKAVGTHEEQLAVYRTIRDQIAERIKNELMV